MYNNPTIQDFKDQFVRDFPYNTDPTVGVTDSDIANAYNFVNLFGLSECFYANQGQYTLGYLLLSAHFLVMNLRASSQGLQGSYSWIQTNKAVGSVSEGYAIPQRILDNPEFAMISKTTYGAQWLMFVLPQLTGMTFSVYGRTRA